MSEQRPSEMAAWGEPEMERPWLNERARASAYESWKRFELRRIEEGRLAEALTDELGHDLLVWIAPGAVDSQRHNTNPDGSAFGDCYKCRNVRDWLRTRLAATPPTPRPPRRPGWAQRLAKRLGRG